MSALTIRLPDDKYERLKALSKRRGTSVNRLMDEMATLLLAEFDAEARFQLRAARGQGQVERGRDLLRKARGESASVSGQALPPDKHHPPEPLNNQEN